MKVLLIGASGQVGAAVIATRPDGVELTALSRRQLDLSDGERIQRAVTEHSPELLINAAAYTAVDRAESEPSIATVVNAVAPQLLASATACIGSRLIHLSTDYVFDGESSRPYLPSDATAPLGVYGRTKLAGEQAVLQTSSLRCVVLRTAWVYSATGHNFVKTMLRVMREKGAVRVVADQIGAPTAATSIAAAIWKFATRPDVHGLHHWTDAGVASWYDFAVAIAEEAGTCGLLDRAVHVEPITTHEYPTPARRPRFSLLDCRETWRALGVQPVHWRVWLRQVLGEIRGA